MRSKKLTRRTAKMWFVSQAVRNKIPPMEAKRRWSEWLDRELAEAWDRAWREIQGIPHWWNTEDNYGEFDLQPLGPDETSEHGAYMAVRESMLDNPYREAK